MSVCQFFPLSGVPHFSRLLREVEPFWIEPDSLECKGDGTGSLTQAMDRIRVRHYLAAAESQADLSVLRRCTHTGRPLGTPDFVTALQRPTLRPLAPRKPGRHKTEPACFRQGSLTIVA
jgi:hypothetical protein